MTADAGKAPGLATIEASMNVLGMPRVITSHPRLLWDQKDIAHYRELMKTDGELKSAFTHMRNLGDKRIQEPLTMPAYRQEPDGQRAFPDYKKGFKNQNGTWEWSWNFNRCLQTRAEEIRNLGVLYALCGDEKYAEFAKRMLLALTDTYGYDQTRSEAKHDSAGPYNHDNFEPYGFDAADVATFLVKACYGYDLIYNLPSITQQERDQIEGGLIRPMGERIALFSKNIFTGHGKWSMLDLYGVLVSGMTVNDQALIDDALYGLGGSKEKPAGGFMAFSSGIKADGHWDDGNIDNLSVSLPILINVAEVMWHNGIDLYRDKNGVLKRPFDALLAAFPGDAGVGKLAGMPVAVCYEYLFRRYHDPMYCPIIKLRKKGLGLGNYCEPPSLFDDPSSGAH